MSFRRKLLLTFSATVVVIVVAVAWSVSAFTGSAFERMDQARTLALVRQFQREFNRRGDEVVQRVQAIAAGDAADRMALGVRQAQPDYAAYVDVAKSIAESQRLDFLEFVDREGKIISSAQWPAKYGYKDPSVVFPAALEHAYLKQQDSPQGASLGIFAIRHVGSENDLYVEGGKRVDKSFLASLDPPQGMQVLLYQNEAQAFSAQFLIDSSGEIKQANKIEPLISEVVGSGHESAAVIQWKGDAEELMRAIPLPARDGHVAAILLIGISRAPYIELNRRIREIALLSAGGGMLLAIFVSNWAARRVALPLEQLAKAARSVAAGDLNVQVQLGSRDELGELADAFNRMTRDLSEQRERLVQAERVAAWRELARRLAHELKNPLFPLQLTVENLVRAHEHSPEMFEEMFTESTATLLAEIANLKTTIGRFSEFSKMPQPHWQQINVNELAQQVMRVFQAQLQSEGKIECRVELSANMPLIAGDADLLHRALSNLILNAMDAMPDGGTMTLTTHYEGDRVWIEVRDTGTGLTPEECDRLFTPYYTTKQHGTGLGLAIVQAVVSDHNGRASARSTPGLGTTFIIELPCNWDKLAVQAEAAR